MAIRFATINYNFRTSYVTLLLFFDAQAVSVRTYKEMHKWNKGQFTADGIGRKAAKLSQGIYIVFNRTFNTAARRSNLKYNCIGKKVWHYTNQYQNLPTVQIQLILYQYLLLIISFNLCGPNFLHKTCHG